MRSNPSETLWLESRRERHRFVLASGLFFLILTIVFGWPLLFGGQTLSGGDIINQYLPYKTEIKRQILQGQFPHWNALTFSGRPLQADIQVGVFYPPNLLAWLLPLPWVFDLTTLFHFWIGAWGMALWMRRRVARASAACLSGALFMFGGYATTRLLPGIVVFIAALAWMPYLFLCWDRLLESFRGLHGRRRSTAATTLVLVSALEILAGAPQIAFYAFVALGLYALILAWRAPGGETSEEDASPASWKEAVIAWLDATLPFRFSQMASLAGVVLLAVGVCAVQLLPSAMMIGESWDRSTGASWDYVVDGSLEPRMLLTYLVPHFFGVPGDEERYWGSSVGYWETNAYVGALPLLLFALFLTARWGILRRSWFAGLDTLRKRDGVRFELFLLILIAIAILFAFGKNSPLFWLAYHFAPGVDRFRVPARILLFYAFGIAALSGWTLDRLLGLPAAPPQTRIPSLAPIAIVAIIGTALCVVFFRMTVPIMHLLEMPYYPFAGSVDDPRAAIAPYLETMARQGSLLFLAQWIVFSVLLCAAAATSHRRRSLATWAIVFVSIAELLRNGHGFLVTERRTELFVREYPQTPRVEFLHDALANGGRFLWFDSLLSYEVDQFQTELLTNRPIIYGLKELRGYDPVNSRRYGLFMNQLTRQPVARNPRAFMFVPDLPAQAIDWRLLNLLDCRAALSYAPLGNPDAEEVRRWSFRLDNGAERILRDYRPKTPAGPAYLVSDVLPVASGTPLEDIMAALGDPRFDVAKKAIVEGYPFAFLPTTNVKPAASIIPAKGSVTLLKQEAGRLSLRVSAPKRSLLVASQTYYPGWQARVDGEKTPVLPANVALCGVGVPPGKHLVELYYRPRQFVQGMTITVASLLIAILLLLRRRPDY